MLPGTSGPARSTPAFDVAVVGAGLVGLASAYRLLEERPELRIVVLDKEDRVAAHQSGHNSGVLHSGVYYSPGSARARMCVAGKATLERFAEEHGVPILRCGKLIVALKPEDLGALEELKARGERNGVAGLEMIPPSKMAEMEPHVAGLGALHVASSAVTDFGLVAEAYASEVTSRGGEIWLNNAVDEMIERSTESVLICSSGELRAKVVVTCAGLYSDRFGPLEERGEAAVRIVPFRGSYRRLAPSARHLVSRLVYPVPDPAMPFLGVHLTPRLDGDVWLGPNAVPALSREGYRRGDLSLSESLEMLRLVGMRRLGKRWWRAGALEIWRDLSERAFLADAQHLLPELKAQDLQRGPSGVRAQAISPDGRLVDDFVVMEGPRSIHVRNAPSPAATASLAIGSFVKERVTTLLGA